jgi:hypothetical protein
MSHEDEPLSPELAALLAGLPLEIEPEGEVWKGVSEQIAPVPLPVFDAPPPAPASRLPWAAVALAAVAMLTLWVNRPVAERDAGPIASPTEVAVTLWQADVRSTTEDLQVVLDAQRASMDPQTLAVIEGALADIDAAIEDVEQALAADPDNDALTLALANVWQRKVHLLRSATGQAG